MSSYLGMRIVCVAIGTIVGQDQAGNDMVVTETEAVSDGRTVWLTDRQFELLKAASESNAA